VPGFSGAAGFATKSSGPKPGLVQPGASPNLVEKSIEESAHGGALQNHPGNSATSRRSILPVRMPWTVFADSPGMDLQGRL